MNSEEMMTGSHIIKFCTSKQEKLVTTELLKKASNVLGLTCKHDAGEGHHNQIDRRSAEPTDYKLNTRENGSFFSNTVGKEDVTKVMGKILNMVEGFINDILPKLSCLQVSTIIEDNNETTNINEIGDLDPTTVNDNDNDSVERANTVLKTNNILGAHIMEEKEVWFHQYANNYDAWNSDSYPSKKEQRGEGRVPHIHQ